MGVLREILGDLAEQLGGRHTIWRKDDGVDEDPLAISQR